MIDEKQRVEAPDPMEDKAVVGRKTSFGDEESDLLDRFERMWFEAHLNRAMLTRSFSLSVSEPVTTTQQRQQQGKQRRRTAHGFRCLLKKFINPILGINLNLKSNGSRRQVHQAHKRHPLSWKVFSRSLHF